MVISIIRDGLSRWHHISLSKPADQAERSAFERALNDFSGQWTKTAKGYRCRYKVAKAIQNRAGRYNAGTSRAERQRVN